MAHGLVSSGVYRNPKLRRRPGSAIVAMAGENCAAGSGSALLLLVDAKREAAHGVVGKHFTFLLIVV